MKKKTFGLGMLLGTMLCGAGLATLAAQDEDAKKEAAKAPAADKDGKKEALKAPVADKDGFFSAFDGKTLGGWTSNDENKGCFTIENGTLKVSGKRAHLFYTGKIGGGEFVNFEFKAKVMTKAKANSGIYIHTQFQKKGWPSAGYECQVNNTHKDPKKTGGLYAVKDVMNTSPVKDDVWFDYYIKVEGKKILIKINGKTTVDYTEPDKPNYPGMPGRKLGKGTFCIQAHDPGSVIFYKDIHIKPLK